jgi:membrane protease YdiL (CAAX protease family)
VTGLRPVLWNPTPFWPIIAFLYGNFAEELFFRGYVQNKLDRAADGRGPWLWGAAIAAQSLLFGLFHVNYDLFPFNSTALLWYVVFSGTFGFIMGTIIRSTGSLLAVAVTHPLWNMRVLSIAAVSTVPTSWTYQFVYQIALLVVAGLIFPPAMRGLMRAFGETTFRRPSATCGGCG